MANDGTQEHGKQGRNSFKTLPSTLTVPLATSDVHGQEVASSICRTSYFHASFVVAFKEVEVYMQAERRVHKDVPEVEKRLAELGLAQDLLLQAAQRGLAAFAACTPHHPRNYPALASWAETFRGLSDLLVVHPYRWTKLDDNGQPQVHSPSGLIAVTVAGGDSNTGRIGDAEPKTSASKGDTTSRAMLENAYLFPEMEADVRAKLDRMNRRQTWFLLVHRDLVAGEMRCEFSMPISMSEDRRIDGWAERILLRPTSFDSALLQGIPDEPTPLTDEVKIELKRRA